MARGPYHDLQSMDCAPGDINSVCTHSDELNKGLPTALRLSARHFNNFFISVVFRVFHLSCNSVFGRLHFVFFISVVLVVIVLVVFMSATDWA